MYNSLLEGGNDMIQLDAALSWNPIVELIDAGVFDENQFVEIFEEAGGTESGFYLFPIHVTTSLNPD